MQLSFPELFKKKWQIVVIILTILISTVLFFRYFLNETGIKSRAVGESVVISFDPTSLTGGATATLPELKINGKPNVDISVQGYEFVLTFDKSHLEVLTITYPGSCPEIGGYSTTAVQANTSGSIRVACANMSTTGYVLSASQNTNLVTISFKSKKAASTNLTIDRTNSSGFSMIDTGAGGSVRTIYASTDHITRSVTTGSSPAATNTPTPTRTPTPSPTQIPGCPEITSDYTPAVLNTGTRVEFFFTSTFGYTNVQFDPGNGATCPDTVVGALCTGYQGNTCWWKWTCTAATAGSHTGTFTATGQNSAAGGCSKTIAYTVGTQPTPTFQTCEAQGGQCKSKSGVCGDGAYVYVSNSNCSSDENCCVPYPNKEFTLNLQLKFQGITRQPPNGLDKMMVKITAVRENPPPGGKKYEEKTAEFTAKQNGIWEGRLTFNMPFANNYLFLIKGPKHIQKRVCVITPTETYPGSYSCSGGDGVIDIHSGVNAFTFAGIYQLVGDLPDQDGIVNSYDTSLVINNLGKSDAEAVRLADLNLDGVVNAQDYSLVIAALSIRADEGL